MARGKTGVHSEGLSLVRGEAVSPRRGLRDKCSRAAAWYTGSGWGNNGTIHLILALCAASWAADKSTAAKADRVVIVKSTRTLTLLNHGQVLKTYQVALGGDPVGPKAKAGDKKTPEGEYVIDSKNSHSRFHLALTSRTRMAPTASVPVDWV